ncbi:MAG: hypothetical protein JAY75_21210, partial [Candidatus Thiodiazotropha taylori]|nr:hypothetical protein [Candidatus Thiodiazotropha taylori]MCW4310738.1 hypothetical protein [Candidatus Thiodiazotropha endolucinida]
KNAEKMWTTYIQKTKYRDIIDSIHEKKRSNLVIQLGLYLDINGHLRCRGMQLYVKVPNTQYCYQEITDIRPW